MECVIPLSVLAKLGKYGVKQYKPYNDAKKLLPENDEALQRSIQNSVYLKEILKKK
jgi:hypothetical protein